MSMKSFNQSRRTFLASAAASAAAAPWIIPAHVLGGPGRVGANDRIQVGVIGCGVRGKYLIANLPAAARIVSLCDCARRQIDSTRHPVGPFAQVLQAFAAQDAGSCSTWQDYRQMLAEETSLDAVIIAAPDHHHAQATILACRAGLDVYVEKPLAVTIAEGRAMVEAARRYERIVQVGSQQRTMEINRQACEFVRSGGLGRLSLVQVRNFPGPMEIVNGRPQAIPDDLDWDLFCGPAPLRPYHQDLWVKDAYKLGYLTWRGWDLWRDYSGHLTTNWGAHALDMVQYALGTDDTGPLEVRLETDLLEEWDDRIDDQWHDKTPPLGAVKDKRRDRLRFCPLTLVYENGLEVRLDPEVLENVHTGGHGTLRMRRNDYQVSPADLLPPPDTQIQQRWKGEGHVARPHLQNWLDCIRTRGEPNAPLEVGHRSATVCHLVNIARELGRNVRWHPQQERFVDDAAANALLSRPRRDGFELPPL
jgi:predicted dehydrogenase